MFTLYTLTNRYIHVHIITSVSLDSNIPRSLTLELKYNTETRARYITVQRNESNVTFTLSVDFSKSRTTLPGRTVKYRSIIKVYLDIPIGNGFEMVKVYFAKEY